MFTVRRPTVQPELISLLRLLSGVMYALAPPAPCTPLPLRILQDSLIIIYYSTLYSLTLSLRLLSLSQMQVGSAFTQVSGNKTPLRAGSRSSQFAVRRI